MNTYEDDEMKIKYVAVCEKYEFYILKLNQISCILCHKAFIDTSPADIKNVKKEMRIYVEHPM